MASASVRRRSARRLAAQTVLPEEIWEEIFLRLDAAADLARASAACSSFRHIVSARQFLRRFRSLHFPPVLGFVGHGCQEFLPVGPPHRSAPEARALVQAADFTFSYLPDPQAWHGRDARDGRVLLTRGSSTRTQFLDIVVCDPLHRRYVQIPRIPVDLLPASTADNGAKRHLFPALAPAVENDEEEWFRVICPVLFEDKAVAFVFSSCNQTWRGIITTIDLPKGFVESAPYYVHGCFYWMFYGMFYSLMLDTSEMEFSFIGLPPYEFDSELAIVEAVDGRLGFLTIAAGTIHLYCKNWQSNGVGAQEWLRNKLIPLPKESGIKYIAWTIVGAVGHCLALRGSRRISHELWKSEYFVLDIKT